MVRLSSIYTITTEGGLVSLGNAGDTGTTSDSFDCNAAYNVDTFTIPQADFNGYIAGDGSLTIEADPSPAVNTFCQFDEVFVKLSYIACGPESTAVVAALGGPIPSAQLLLPNPSASVGALVLPRRRRGRPLLLRRSPLLLLPVEAPCGFRAPRRRKS